VPPLLAGAALGLLTATAYALLAGFAIPTRRALLMLSVVLLALWLRRPLRPGRGLALAAMAVLAVDPLATLDPGFWLSFLAVAVIALVVQGRLPADSPVEEGVAAGRSRWRRRLSALEGFGRLQLWIVIGMAPATGLLFSQVPLVSPVANALLVPVFGLLIVPGTLVGLLLLPWLPGPALVWLGWLAAGIDQAWPLLDGSPRSPGACSACHHCQPGAGPC
jgi:competence protein ComEC